ncbi:hypothetical protein CSOJ01_02888 [Colletotrichum sojae]|uniref:Uncharacterized protein n=1 Tax=Colletotrichum sojae TaxID=2175907 RepID=A0A8H6JPT3_9PEZI|nr:hypothetical protein CSOJ01_02888 [Colletotrichum sojae]
MQAADIPAAISPWSNTQQGKEGKESRRSATRTLDRAAILETLRGRTKNLPTLEPTSALHDDHDDEWSLLPLLPRRQSHTDTIHQHLVIIFQYVIQQALTLIMAALISASCLPSGRRQGADAAASSLAHPARRPYSPVYSPPNAIPPPSPRNPRPKRRSSTPSGTVPPHPAQQQKPTFAGREREHSEKATRVRMVGGGGSCLGRSL